LPELAIAVSAVLKGRNEIALGNIIGSNILNIGLVLGLASAINPLSVSGTFTTDALVLVLVTLMLCLFMFNGKHRMICRREATIFILTYAVYTFYVIRRG
jgi:cation:H+ antiporter